MPGFDGSGPAGMGPMTGGARGYCAGYAPEYGPGFRYGGMRGWGGGRFGRGRGFGRGFGRGYGWRAGGGMPPRFTGYGAGFQAQGIPPQFADFQGWYGAPQSRRDEIDMLKGQADMLKAEMEAVERRLDELAAEVETSS